MPNANIYLNNQYTTMIYPIYNIATTYFTLIYYCDYQNYTPPNNAIQIVQFDY